MAEPTPPTIYITVGDTLYGSEVGDNAEQSAWTLTDIIESREIRDRVEVGYVLFSASQRVRGTEIPADPYFDDDGDPTTPEMMVEEGLAAYLRQVGANLFVTEGGGSAEDWEAKSLAQKCQWICEYDAPAP